MTKKLARSGTYVGLVALFAKSLSIFRDAALAHRFGAGAGMDLFTLVDRVAKLLYGLLVDGVLAQAFTPVLAECYCKGRQKSVKNLINCVLVAAMFVASALGAIGFARPQWIAQIFCPGWMNQASEVDPRYSTAIKLLPISFIILFLMTMSGALTCILSVHKKLILSAFVPIFINSTLIFTLLLTYRVETPIAIYWICFALPIGALVSCALQWMQFKRLNLGFSTPLSFNDRYVLKVLSLLPACLLHSLMLQANKWLSTSVSSSFSIGTFSSLYYAQRIVELPTGILTVVVASVLAPALAKQFQKKVGNTKTGFAHALRWGTRLILLFILPAILLLSQLAGPLLQNLFFSAQTDPVALKYTYDALQIYLIGGIGCVFSALFSSAYYARQAGYLAVRYSFLGCLLDAGLNLLALKAGYLCIPWGYAVGQWVRSGVLVYGLVKAGYFHSEKGYAASLLKIVAAAGFMFLALYSMHCSLNWWGDQSTLITALTVGLNLVIGLSVYLLTLLTFCCDLKAWLVGPRSEIETLQALNDFSVKQLGNETIA